MRYDQSLQKKHLETFEMLFHLDKSTWWHQSGSDQCLTVRNKGVELVGTIRKSSFHVARFAIEDFLHVRRKTIRRVNVHAGSFHLNFIENLITAANLILADLTQRHFSRRRKQHQKR